MSSPASVTIRRRSVESNASAWTCSHCKLRDLCAPHAAAALQQSLADWSSPRRRLRRGESLFRCGAPFDAVYAVHSGCFKTSVSTHDGREQITGFQIGGDLLGLDGFAAGQHASDAVALEDSQVCVITQQHIEERAAGSLQQRLLQALGCEIVRGHGVMLMLGRLRADERLAAFLVSLSQRLSARGFSANALVLRMSREEIGAYLGLTLETVSRALSRLHETGVLQVRHRQIQILDAQALQSRLPFAVP